MANRLPLSTEDVQQLMTEPSSENRALAAEKVANAFRTGNFGAQERTLAEDIFRLLLKDAAVRVRQALSDSLKDNPDVPHDVAAALARDVDEVALPMIEQSVVLTDEDLIALVTSGESAAKQVAVAGRDSVSEQVSAAVADSGNSDAVATLVKNDGAAISSATFDQVLRSYADTDSVKDGLALRKDLPLDVAERLVSVVSSKLQSHLEKNFNFKKGVSAEAVMQESRERATVSLLEGDKNTKSVMELVDQIYSNGRLTPTLLIRALCMGDSTFFEAGLARLVNIPVANAYQLVRDRGELGLKKLFLAAGMPQDFIPIARAAIELVDETVSTSGDDRGNFRSVMIERVLTRVEDEMDAENLHYLINKMARSATQEGAA